MLNSLSWQHFIENWAELTSMGRQRFLWQRFVKNWACLKTLITSSCLCVSGVVLFFSNRKLDGGNVWWTFNLCKDFLLGDCLHFELHIIHGTNSFSLQLSSSSPVRAPYPLPPLSLDICRFHLMCWLCLFQFGPEEHNSQVSPLLNAQAQVLLSRIPLVGRSLLLAACQWQWQGLALHVLTTFHCARGIGHLHQFQCSSLLYVLLWFCFMCLFVCCCFWREEGSALTTATLPIWNCAFGLHFIVMLSPTLQAMRMAVTIPFHRTGIRGVAIHRTLCSVFSLQQTPAWVGTVE